MGILRTGNATGKIFWMAAFCALPVVAFAANGSGMSNNNANKNHSAPAAHTMTAPAHGLKSSTNIRHIQSALNQKEHANLAVDGRLGPKTMAAIKKFQASRGLPTTGHPNALTENALGL